MNNTVFGNSWALNLAIGIEGEEEEIEEWRGKNRGWKRRESKNEKRKRIEYSNRYSIWNKIEPLFDLNRASVWNK